MKKELITLYKTLTAMALCAQTVKTVGFVFASCQMPIDPVTGGIVVAACI